MQVGDNGAFRAKISKLTATKLWLFMKRCKLYCLHTSYKCHVMMLCYVMPCHVILGPKISALIKLERLLKQRLRVIANIYQLNSQTISSTYSDSSIATSHLYSLCANRHRYASCRTVEGGAHITAYMVDEDSPVMRIFLIVFEEPFLMDTLTLIGSPW